MATNNIKQIKLPNNITYNIELCDDSKKLVLASAALTGTPTAPTAAAGTNTTQIATTAFVNTEINNKIAAADAMIYKGTIGTNGTVTSLPTTHKTGYTYKVITAGNYAGVKCEVGDMIICLIDGTTSNNAHWTVIQNNIDGAVIGPASSIDNRVAIFNGTTGKLIEDSGFTIATSVPANAKFTDTTYTFATGSSNGTFNVTPLGGTAQPVAIKGLGSAAYTASTAYDAAGAASTVQTNLNTHTGNTTVHITAAERTAWNAKSNFSGNYNDLTNKPTIPAAYILPAAGSSLGGVKTGGDVTISNGTITVNDDSHNHVISNVDGLQTALDGKLKRGSYERIEGTSSAKKDLNNYTTAGFYNVKTANVNNCPSGIGIDAVLLVYAWDKSDYECQEITETAASEKARRWIRHKTGSAWTAWKAIINEENIGSQSVASAATATKVTNKLTVKLNGGSTEGTNLFTFDGSAAKTLNITASSIGAAPAYTYQTTDPGAGSSLAAGKLLFVYS